MATHTVIFSPQFCEFVFPSNVFRVRENGECLAGEEGPVSNGTLARQCNRL